MALMTRTLVASVGTLLLAGCATAPPEPALTAAHPASPDAAQSPLPARSPTLALGETSPPPVLEPMPAMEHGAPNPGMKDMVGMHQHGGGGMPGMRHEAPPTQPGENAAPS